MDSRAPIGLLAASLAAFTALALPANAATLYKSVDRDGRVIFSDMPIQGVVAQQRIEMSDTAKPVVSPEPAIGKLALADSLDEAVSRANAQMDMAEHALAVARSTIASAADPLVFGQPRLSRSDAQRIEFYKRDVLEARRSLLRVLKLRNSTPSSPPVA